MSDGIPRKQFKMDVLLPIGGFSGGHVPDEYTDTKVPTVCKKCGAKWYHQPKARWCELCGGKLKPYVQPLRSRSKVR